MSYGQQSNVGAVLVCSKDSYLRLLGRWGFEAERGLAGDFGILTYADSDTAVYATLDRRKFSFEEFELEDRRPKPAELALVSEFFTRMAALENGTADSESRVVRWSAGFWDNEEKLSGAVQQVFGSWKDSGPAKHVTLFRPRPDDCTFERDLNELASRLSKHRGFQILRISAGRRLDATAHDGRFKEQLKVWREFSHSLEIEFEDRASLEKYYESEFHSIERENLYKRLDPTVVADLDEAREIKDAETDRAGAIFRRVEERLADSRRILRLDTSRAEPIEALVKIPGIPFGTYDR
jgi:hypothetical protein